MQVARRKPDEAMAAFNEVLKLNPQSDRGADSAVAAATSRRARPDRRCSSRRTPPSEPGDPNIQLNLARNLLAKGQTAQAEPIVKQLMAKFPDARAGVRHGRHARDCQEGCGCGARKNYEHALASIR